jgi:hypothetical protein
MTAQDEIKTGSVLLDDIDTGFQEAKKMNAQYREHEFNKISESLKEIRMMLGLTAKA